MALGLGRGLEALIPNTKSSRRVFSKKDDAVMHLEITKIKSNPQQPRKRFSLPELESLSASIKQYGILEPLIVSPDLQSRERYVLIAGERRLRAAELAGLQKVPVVLRSSDEQEKLEIALVENIQREDLNPLEEARALRKLLSDFNLGQEEVAKKVGRSRSKVANSLRLLDLAAEVQRALLEEQISEGHAKVIMSLTNQAHQIELLHKILDENLSVRQTEKLASSFSSKRPRKYSLPDLKEQIDPEDEKISRKLSQRLGAKVQVIRAHKGGRFVIEYYSQEERDRLCQEIIGSKEQIESLDQEQKSTKFSI